MPMTIDEVIDCLRLADAEQVERLLTRPCEMCFGRTRVPGWQPHHRGKLQECPACRGTGATPSHLAIKLREIAEQAARKADSSE